MRWLPYVVIAGVVLFFLWGVCVWLIMRPFLKQEALFIASCDGDTAQVRVVIANGARVDHTGSDLEDTPLYCAVFNGHDETAAALVEAGAGAFVKGEHGTAWSAARGPEMQRILKRARDWKKH